MVVVGWGVCVGGVGGWGLGYNSNRTKRRSKDHDLHFTHTGETAKIE